MKNKLFCSVSSHYSCFQLKKIPQSLDKFKYVKQEDCPAMFISLK